MLVSGKRCGLGFHESCILKTKKNDLLPSCHKTLFVTGSSYLPSDLDMYTFVRFLGNWDFTRDVPMGSQKPELVLEIDLTDIREVLAAVTNIFWRSIVFTLESLYHCWALMY